MHVCFKSLHKIVERLTIVYWIEEIELTKCLYNKLRDCFEFEFHILGWSLGGVIGLRFLGGTAKYFGILFFSVIELGF